MLKKLFTLAAAVACAAVMTACGGEDTTDIGGQAQVITTANVTTNAQDWQKANSAYAGWTMAVQGDPVVSETCLPGSGTGTATLEHLGRVITLYCSTYSRFSCATDESEVQGFGTCNTSLKFPQLLGAASH